ncbi:MAG: NAD(P)-binding protein [Chitinophagales bacterium]
MKICVIGTGISGLSIANMLNDKHDVVVYEKESKIGGLIKCTREEGNLFHRVGGHVFNSKNQKVLDWFWQYFDRDNEFLKATRNAKIFMNNMYLGYPLENYIHKLAPEVVSDIIDDLLVHDQNVEYSNFAEFLEGNFGPTLYNLYFKPYNEKIWNTDLTQVPLDWLEGKLPMPNVKEIILNNIIKKDETNMVHATFYYAKVDGSQFIVDRFAEKLNITVGEGINKIDRVDGKWSINGELFDKVVYSGDIRKLGDILTNKSNELNHELETAKEFKSNGTSNVLCYTDDGDLSWLYFPEKSFIPHRIIYTGNFSDTNNVDERKTCTVEFSGKYSEAEMRKELKKMPGHLEPIAFNYEPNSYVINTFETRATVNSIKNQLEKDGFYLIGRFAEWQYYNMDKCIEAAFDIADRIEG